MGRAGAVARPDTLTLSPSNEQWDTSKSLTDDISYSREKGGLRERSKAQGCPTTGSSTRQPRRGSLLPSSWLWLSSVPQAECGVVTGSLLHERIYGIRVGVHALHDRGQRGGARPPPAVDEPRRGLWKLWTCAPAGARPITGALTCCRASSPGCSPHRLCCMERDLNVRHRPDAGGC